MELCHGVAAEHLATVLKHSVPPTLCRQRSLLIHWHILHQSETKISSSRRSSAFHQPKSSDLGQITKVQFKNLWSRLIFLYINGSPVVCFTAVNAARPIGSRGNIIQVSKHARATGIRSIDLCGVVQALVRQLLAANCCSDGRGKMDVTFIRLVHL